MALILQRTRKEIRTLDYAPKIIKIILQNFQGTWKYNYRCRWEWELDMGGTGGATTYRGKQMRMNVSNACMSAIQRPNDFKPGHPTVITPLLPQKKILYKMWDKKNKE